MRTTLEATGTVKVLYVTTRDSPDAATVLGDLRWLQPPLEIKQVSGLAGAVVEISTVGGYGALFLAPSFPQNEALALISSLRRNRTPIAIVAIITERDRSFFAHAMMAGADDVLVLRGDSLIAVEETLKRVRQNPHTSPEPGQPLLRVVFAGQDDLTWNLVSEIPFVQATRTMAGDDGSIATRMSGLGVGPPADVLIIDEHQGDVHPLQVVKWAHANAPATPIIVLTGPTPGDMGGAALELGADQVVGKTGTYRRRIVASLHRLFLQRQPSEMSPVEPLSPSERTSESEAEIARLTSALRSANERIESLSKAAQAATTALTSLRADQDQQREVQAFERALRDRDREELGAITRELHEERERCVVLEHTLKHTEDRAGAETTALQLKHQAERRRLEEEVAKVADRLHQVAHNTQTLQTRLELQIVERVAERDRLADNAFIGHAVFYQDGRLVRCNDTFAKLLGYSAARDAVTSSGNGAFAGTPDHAEIVARLKKGATIDRIESTLRRADGRPVRVLTSAVLLSSAGGGEVERLVVDQTDKASVEMELQLARRLEAAGRLAAEMAPQIEAALADFEKQSDAQPAGERGQVVLLVRQLLSFTRQQAKPAGFLSLNDAIVRSEQLLRQMVGGAVELEIQLADVEPVAAGEEDIEQLLVEVVNAAASCLPFGGRLTLVTSLKTDVTFVLRTTLTAIAAGYGVLPCATPSSLVRNASRCGGTLRISGEAGRSSTLHVHLPC